MSKIGKAINSIFGGGRDKSAERALRQQQADLDARLASLRNQQTKTNQRRLAGIRQGQNSGAANLVYDPNNTQGRSTIGG